MSHASLPWESRPGCRWGRRLIWWNRRCLPLVHCARDALEQLEGRSVLPAGWGDGIRLPPRGVGDDWGVRELRHTLVDVMHLRPVLQAWPSIRIPLRKWSAGAPLYDGAARRITAHPLHGVSTLVCSRGCGPSATRRLSGAAASHAAGTVRGDSFTLHWAHLPLVCRIHVPGPPESAPPFRDINPHRCELLS